MKYSLGRAALSRAHHMLLIHHNLSSHRCMWKAWGEFKWSCVHYGCTKAFTLNQNELSPRHHKKLCWSTHCCKTPACISMHGALQQKTRVQLSYARGERRSYDNCFHVITALRSEIVTWLSGLLWVLALHQLLPCVVTYCFAAYKHPSKHNARVSLSVPTHEWWHTLLSHTESHTAGKPWEALEEGDLHLPHQATMWFCLIWLELLSCCLNKGCLKDQPRIKRKARGCSLFFFFDPAKSKLGFLLILLLRW